jgi:A/G-specific adenine glycosylase
VPTSADLSPRATAIGRRLRVRLLAWFACHRRDLPWRTSRDPYRIWVSEIMLQQTQVATVVPYFERFVRAFPTLRHLATADEDQVLRLWEGLGYYRRARDLHAAARRIMREHGGRFPSDATAVAELPGMGRYTVGAVLSQAFGCRLPVLEANSLRVLCRLFGRRDDPRRGPAQRWLWQTAKLLLPRRNVGDYNQALMELGALVCTPKPSCSACPLATLCEARRQGVQGEIPLRLAPIRTQRVREVAVVVHRGSKVLLVQRPPEGRWPRLWEFPHGPLADEILEQAVQRHLLELTGIRAGTGTKLTTIRHTVTRFTITMVCVEARYLRGSFHSRFYLQGKWLGLDRLAEYPLSAPHRQLAHAVMKNAAKRAREAHDIHTKRG